MYCIHICDLKEIFVCTFVTLYLFQHQRVNQFYRSLSCISGLCSSLYATILYIHSETFSKSLISCYASFSPITFGAKQFVMQLCNHLPCITHARTGYYSRAGPALMGLHANFSGYLDNMVYGRFITTHCSFFTQPTVAVSRSFRMETKRHGAPGTQTGQTSTK